MNIQIDINELVLHGFHRKDRRLISEAMKSELHRLFVERGAPSGLNGMSNRRLLDSGSFHVDAGHNPGFIGKQVAHSLYHQFKATAINIAR